MSRRPALHLAMPAGDLVLVVGVFMLGYWLRHFALPSVVPGLFGEPGAFRLSAYQYLVSGAVMGGVQVLILQAFGAYRSEWGLGHIEELAWILRSSFMAVVITFAVSFVTRQLFFSRFVLVFAFPVNSVVLALWHWVCRRAVRSAAYRRGTARRTVFYGCGRLAAELAAHMEGKAEVPSRVLGFIRPEGSSEPPAVPAEARPNDLEAWLAERSADLLVIADTAIPRDETAAAIIACEHAGISYMLVPDVFALMSLTTRVAGIGGTTLIQSVPSPLRGFRSLLKRTLDLSITLILLPLLAPLFLAIAALIAADSGFPVFYSQRRLGRDNRPFRMIKFRSMRVGADREKVLLTDMNEASGPLFKMKRDPRVTRAGRLLRRWSLDELPQLLNVLAGHMSLVGPRPPLPEEVERYSDRHLKRLQTVPGLTGIWQVSGRSQLSFEEMVKLDIYYVDNWSIWLDLAILLLTVPAALSRRGAY